MRNAIHERRAELWRCFFDYRLAHSRRRSPLAPSAGTNRAGSSFRGGLSPEFVDQLQEFLGQRLADHLRVELVELSIEPTISSRRIRFMELFHLVNRVFADRGVVWRVAGALSLLLLPSI